MEIEETNEAFPGDVYRCKTLWLRAPGAEEGKGMRLLLLRGTDAEGG